MGPLPNRTPTSVGTPYGGDTTPSVRGGYLCQIESDRPLRVPGNPVPSGNHIDGKTFPCLRCPFPPRGTPLLYRGPQSGGRVGVVKVTQTNTTTLSSLTGELFVPVPSTSLRLWIRRHPREGSSVLRREVEELVGASSSTKFSNILRIISREGSLRPVVVIDVIIYCSLQRLPTK